MSVVRERPKADARQIAARLWPGPGSVDFCRREAVADLVRFDAAIAGVASLRARAYARLFDDLGHLWIQPTDSEELLGKLRDELRRALGSVTDALDRLGAARAENEIQFLDERLFERVEQGR